MDQALSFDKASLVCEDGSTLEIENLKCEFTGIDPASKDPSFSSIAIGRKTGRDLTTFSVQFVVPLDSAEADFWTAILEAARDRPVLMLERAVFAGGINESAVKRNMVLMQVAFLNGWGVTGWHYSGVAPAVPDVVALGALS